MSPPLSPRSFRRRLAFAFVVVAGLSAGFLAVTSYFAIREYRMRAFEDQAERKVEIAELALPDEIGASSVEKILAQYQQRAGFETVAVADGTVYSSSPALDVTAVPSSVRSNVGESSEGTRTENAGTRYLVFGRLADDEATQLYFFFSIEEVLGSVDQFRNVLMLSWLVTVGVAALAGAAIARRTLRPIRDAADAARALGTRLLGDEAPPGTDDEFGLWAESFQELASALEAKIAELSEAAERERRITSDVAHELRTPLTSLVSASELLQEQLGDLPSGAQRPAQLLVHDIRRLRALVVELLEMARLDAGEGDVTLEAVELRDALAAVVSPRQRLVHVRLETGPPVRVLVDRTRFNRVLSNLLDNAIRHGGGDVEVDITHNDAFAVIEVVDHGPGVALSDAEKIFDRLYKASSGRSTAGSGLGLSIAREHARLTGGDVVLVNPGEHGARFRYRVPLATATGVAPREPETHSARL